MSGADPYPFAVYWPDGGSAGRYSHALAAHIKAEVIGGTYTHEPREELAR